jgi:hypothetical protein
MEAQTASTAPSSVTRVAGRRSRNCTGLGTQHALPEGTPAQTSQLDWCIEFARRHDVRSLVADASSMPQYWRNTRLAYDRCLEDHVWLKALQKAQVRLPKGDPSNSAIGTPSAPCWQQCAPPTLIGSLQDPPDGEGPLRFSGAFESGNLCSAWLLDSGAMDTTGSRCSACYDLLMQPDTLSRGHTQWFFFCSCAS